MPLTRDFKETVKARADRDPKFRAALLQEAVGALVGGELGLGKQLLRNYIKATAGFDAVSKSIGVAPKSLMRMLSDSGNPGSNNLFRMIRHLQNLEGISLGVVSVGPDPCKKKNASRKRTRNRARAR